MANGPRYQRPGTVQCVRCVAETNLVARRGGHSGNTRRRRLGRAAFPRRAAATTPVVRYQIAPPRNGQLVLGTNPYAGGIALSPDATTAAIVATVDGKTGLWLSPLDGSPPRLVEGADDPAYPFWSPDSKSVGFFGRGVLLRVDLTNGDVLKVCAVPGFGVGGAWLEDGTILFGMIGSGLMRVPSSGGTFTLLTHLQAAPGERDHISPQALPGGRFMYLAQNETRENGASTRLSWAIRTGEYDL